MLQTDEWDIDDDDLQRISRSSIDQITPDTIAIIAGQLACNLIRGKLDPEDAANIWRNCFYEIESAIREHEDNVQWWLEFSEIRLLIRDDFARLEGQLPVAAWTLLTKRYGPILTDHFSSKSPPTEWGRWKRPGDLTDEELLGIRGMGPHLLKSIRKVLPEPATPQTAPVGEKVALG